VIAGTGSNSGKTTLSLGIMKYLSEIGYKVAPFKVGPDFIDPGHHTKICETQSINLDSWMLSEQYNQSRFKVAFDTCDVAVVEGVMGLFDGYSGTSESGSTAQMAKWLNLPVILVVDAKSMARSAAAIVQGFENFDKKLNVAGIIFNRVGSQNHYNYLKEAVEENCRARSLGYIFRNDKIHLPDRHLGLVTAEEYVLPKEALGELVSAIDKNTALREFVHKLPEIDAGEYQCSDPENFENADNVIEKKITIGIARDKAFCFYYKDNIDILKRNGAKIVEFSPLTDSSLPDNIHGIYLGGGYPELFAEKLSKNVSLLKEIKAKSKEKMPIYGECGGFMYLCSFMTDLNREKQYQMTGCFPFSVEMNSKLRSLGYREITLKKSSLIGGKGSILRGHEFHYSSLLDEEPEKSHFQDSIANIYDVTKRDGKILSLPGFLKNNTLGSYLHLHFGSMKHSGKSFVRACLDYKNGEF
jgi:cobyrinic acid a,c-diamide synthase